MNDDELRPPEPRRGDRMTFSLFVDEQTGIVADDSRIIESAPEAAAAPPPAPPPKKDAP